MRSPRLSLSPRHRPRRPGVYNLSSPVIPTIPLYARIEGEMALWWENCGGVRCLCRVWEGILIQHATHDVGPTMTAPIPALIFHRFYSRPSPSPFLRPTSPSLLAPAPARPPSLSLCLRPPRYPSFSLQSLPPPPFPAGATTAATTRNRRSCHHGNPIFYTVKPVCLSSRPRLISSFQNRNVMGRQG